MVGHQLIIKRVPITVVAFALVAIQIVLARPYYFEDIQAAVEAAQAQAQGQVGDAIAEVQPQVAGGPHEPPIPARIGGHLNQLYSHGTKAVQSAVSQVQPDLSNIGRDISEAYQQTSTNVGKRIEPIAQTIRPYIDQAQKAVAPYVNQAKEEVPKLIKQTGPALTNLGSQVRDVATGVWGKITGSGQAAAESASQQVQKAGEQIQETAARASETAGAAVQQQIQAAGSNPAPPPLAPAAAAPPTA